MLTTQKILEIVAEPRVTGMTIGKLEAVRRGRTSGDGRRMIGQQDEAWINDVASLQGPVVGRVSAHPGHVASGTLRSPTPLTASDILWLQRLPLDPAEITYREAVQLAELVNSVPQEASSDRRLLDSVWAPVKATHDRRSAEAELERSRQPLVDPPATTLAVLSDAVAREHPNLTPNEAASRASALLEAQLTDRAAQREREIAAIEQQLVELGADAERRNSVVHA